jgi:hypothetical protein
MSDDRQPNYDFFAPPRPAAPPEQRPAPTSYANPPNSAYPGAPAGPLRDVVPGSVPFADSLPPVRSGMPRWAVALIVAVAAFFGIAILAAVAVPVFLSQRMKADFAATSVALPAALNGVERNTSPEAVAVAKNYAMEDIGGNDVAIYGPVDPNMVIVTAARTDVAQSEQDQRVQRTLFERALAGQGLPISLQGGPVADELGGWAGCARTTKDFNICLATSTGAVVAVISGPSTADPMAQLSQVRAAAVHHS